MPDVEPDPRFALAAERTLLAYLRTGLALLAAGVAVATALPEAGAQALRRGLGAALVLLGVLALVGAQLRYQRVDAALRASAPLPPPRTALVLTGGLVLVGAGALVVVLVA